MKRARTGKVELQQERQLSQCMNVCQYRVVADARAWKLRQTWIPELDKPVIRCEILEIIIVGP